MNKDANDEEAATGSSFEKVVLDLLDRDISAHPERLQPLTAELARRGRLMRVTRGMYVTVTASRFDPVPPPVSKVVQSLARITGHTIVRHGAAAANALGLTTQVPVRQSTLPMAAHGRSISTSKSLKSAVRPSGC